MRSARVILRRKLCQSLENRTSRQQRIRTTFKNAMQIRVVRSSIDLAGEKWKRCSEQGYIKRENGRPQIFLVAAWQHLYRFDDRATHEKQSQGPNRVRGYRRRLKVLRMRCAAVTHIAKWCTAHIAVEVRRGCAFSEDKDT